MQLPLPMPFVISRFHCRKSTKEKTRPGFLNIFPSLEQHQLHEQHYEECICNGWKALTIRLSAVYYAVHSLTNVFCKLDQASHWIGSG